MGGTRTRAAVLREAGKPWEIAELDLDPPKEREVQVRFMASGLCHSDEHIRQSGVPNLPFVGGHEGAGIVEAVGPGTSRVQVGDHIVCSFIPACGSCRYCSTGHQNLCDRGLHAATGYLQDETYRFHENGVGLGGMCVLGTFSQRAVVSEWSCVKIDDDIPFEVACLVGCGVPTGWGSAVYAAGVRAGDTVVVFGTGGVGINAVQGARYAGAKQVIAVDPVEFKREMAKKVGATDGFADFAEAKQFVIDSTRGQLADHAILTVGEMTAEVIEQGVEITGKNCQVTIVGVGKRGQPQIVLGTDGRNPLIGYQRRLQGALAGATNPLYDIKKLLDLYRAGDLKLDELVTRRYRLDQINEGYQDLLDGKNVRGVIIHEHD